MVNTSTDSLKETSHSNYQIEVNVLCRPGELKTDVERELLWADASTAAYSFTSSKPIVAIVGTRTYLVLLE